MKLGKIITLLAIMVLPISHINAQFTPSFVHDFSFGGSKNTYNAPYSYTDNGLEIQINTTVTNGGGGITISSQTTGNFSYFTNKLGNIEIDIDIVSISNINTCRYRLSNGNTGVGTNYSPTLVNISTLDTGLQTIVFTAPTSHNNNDAFQSINFWIERYTGTCNISYIIKEVRSQHLGILYHPLVNNQSSQVIVNVPSHTFDVGTSVMLGGILMFMISYWIVGLSRRRIKSE
jgi:hypothetical protein